MYAPPLKHIDLRSFAKTWQVPEPSSNGELSTKNHDPKGFFSHEIFVKVYLHKHLVVEFEHNDNVSCTILILY